MAAIKQKLKKIVHTKRSAEAARKIRELTKAKDRIENSFPRVRGDYLTIYEKGYQTPLKTIYER